MNTNTAAEALESKQQKRGSAPAQLTNSSERTNRKLLKEILREDYVKLMRNRKTESDCKFLPELVLIDSDDNPRMSGGLPLSASTACDGETAKSELRAMFAEIANCFNQRQSTTPCPIGNSDDWFGA